jgi:FkbM family methyltransferase
MKELIRNLCVNLGLGLTSNLRNDILINKILRRELSETSNCIDVGAHKGDFVDEFLKYAKKGNHLAFEPLPAFFKLLKRKYGDRIQLHLVALSDNSGSTQFQYVENAPAYSGLRQRRYDIPNPEIQEIVVNQERLDNLVDSEWQVDLIKIDVEGAEYKVLMGSKNLLSKQQPLIIFEFGKGAADHYDITPLMMFELLTNMGYKIYTLSDFLRKKSPFNATDFAACYDRNDVYNFIAGKS